MTVQATRQPFLSLPVRRTDIDPDLVLDVVAQVGRDLGQHPVTLHLSDHPDPLITAVENERRAAIRLSSLTRRLERAGTRPCEDAVGAAFNDWLDARPVSDAEAAKHGIATIGWNRQGSHLLWRVVVVRPSGLTLDWVPTLHTDSGLVHTIRKDAKARAAAVPVTVLPAGDVTVWLHLDNPALSTAAFTQLDALLGPDQDPARTDLYAVFTPGRPVAVAPLVPATRLTEESNEPHFLLPLTEFEQIGWV